MLGLKHRKKGLYRKFPIYKKNMMKAYLKSWKMCFYISINKKIYSNKHTCKEYIILLSVQFRKERLIEYGRLKEY